ncbi:hypothetical protein [Isoptericola sp. G70]|uniref:hypothetical protein n=1 Tax=Isoptericola sp. G70 TaxID=3376633 RepID=UPI003A7F9E47
MGSSSGKQSSARLTELRGKDEVLAFLRASGFDVAAAARAQFGDGEPVGALLVGSVAEGYQTASSDVDILFLTYAERDDLRTSSSLLIESGRSFETLTYADGVEVNTEVICRDDYDSLADRLDHVAGAMAVGAQMSKLPMIDNYSLRFLHRLRTGIVLFGDDVVDEFRVDFHVQALPLYLSVKYLVLARESLEDARSASHATPGLVEFICRDILEHCLLALAAGQGFTSQSRRFVMNWLADAAPDAPHGEWFRALRSRLLTRTVVGSDAKQALVDEASEAFEYVRSALREDPVRRRVVDQVFARITYAD